jgi:hypothetical protein
MAMIPSHPSHIRTNPFARDFIRLAAKLSLICNNRFDRKRPRRRKIFHDALDELLHVRVLDAIPPLLILPAARNETGIAHPSKMLRQRWPAYTGGIGKKIEPALALFDEFQQNEKPSPVGDQAEKIGDLLRFRCVAL